VQFVFFLVNGVPDDQFVGFTSSALVQQRLFGGAGVQAVSRALEISTATRATVVPAFVANTLDGVVAKESDVGVFVVHTR
jgi:hypothetical protein